MVNDQVSVNVSIKESIHVVTNETPFYLMEDPIHVATNESNPFTIIKQMLWMFGIGRTFPIRWHGKRRSIYINKYHESKMIHG
jgi:hypothetical protein